MKTISGIDPVMRGPSIIGFGNRHYIYDTGREGDVPIISFSPRKNAITFYFMEGFDRYTDELSVLGKYKTSVSCLYVKKLTDINIDILTRMLKISYGLSSTNKSKPTTVEEYIALIPNEARPLFDELRTLVTATIPHAKEVYSYGIIGYKIDDKRARVFISGWKDHLGMYPIPKDAELQKELAPYIKGKGTLWLALDQPLPKELIVKTVKALTT